MEAAKRKEKSRAAFVAAGLKRVEVWVKPSDHEKIKKYAEKLRVK